MKNLKVKDFLKRLDTSEYNVLIKHIKPKGEIAGVRADSDSFTFAEVEKLKKVFGKPNVEDLIETYRIAFKITKDQLFEARVVELAQSNKFLYKYLERVVKLESKLSNSTQEEASTKWKMAGGEAMNQLGILATTVPLAKEFGVKPSDVAKWEWLEVYSIRLYESLHGQIQRNASQIR